MIWLSHGRHELVEGCLDAVAGGNVGGDFVVAAAQVWTKACDLGVLMGQAADPMRPPPTCS
jgi:hypothetical protein